jgi:hypothetical protein
VRGLHPALVGCVDDDRDRAREAARERRHVGAGGARLADEDLDRPRLARRELELLGRREGQGGDPRGFGDDPAHRLGAALQLLVGEERDHLGRLLLAERVLLADEGEQLVDLTERVGAGVDNDLRPGVLAPDPPEQIQPVGDPEDHQVEVARVELLRGVLGVARGDQLDLAAVARGRLDALGLLRLVLDEQDPNR